jgi:hypothetical protein
MDCGRARESHVNRDPFRVLGQKFLEGTAFAGMTAQYTRSPGNPLHCQIETFRAAPGEYHEIETEERKSQLALVNALTGVGYAN